MKTSNQQTNIYRVNNQQMTMWCF